MRLENGVLDSLKKDILLAVGKYLDLARYKVFFFGSRVTGTGDERSDIDVGIEGLEPVPLGLLSKIQSELNNSALLYKIQIVDFGSASDDFRRVALSQIEIINPHEQIKGGR